MDDPGSSWPAWKFGMRRDELFTTLHDQYNTFASTIQDPDAFHHDVYEIASEASTVDQFHRLMAGRKDQRLRELNESLESASFEIIANPALIGTTQWAFALQLFRTKSLDSLVRYFSSYLPADHAWHRFASSSTARLATTQDNDKQGSSTISAAAAAAFPHSFQPFLPSSTHITEEPLSMSDADITGELPLSLPLSSPPRSMTTGSVDSLDSLASTHFQDSESLTSGPRTPACGSEVDATELVIVDSVSDDGHHHHHLSRHRASFAEERPKVLAQLQQPQPRLGPLTPAAEQCSLPVAPNNQEFYPTASFEDSHASPISVVAAASHRSLPAPTPWPLVSAAHVHDSDEPEDAQPCHAPPSPSSPSPSQPAAAAAAAAATAAAGRATRSRKHTPRSRDALRRIQHSPDAVGRRGRWGHMRSSAVARKPCLTWLRPRDRRQRKPPVR